MPVLGAFVALVITILRISQL